MSHRIQYESGYTTLAISLLLLVIVTMASLFTVKPIVLENKITNNVDRSNVSLEAAEAGMSAAYAYLAIDPDVNSDNVIDAVFDTDGDGLGDSNQTDVGDATAMVTVQDLSGGDMTIMAVTSTGFSDDRSARRGISQLVGHVDPLPNHPDNPLTTRGTVVIDGSATVHNPEGHSTIWSGGDVDLGANNSTATNVANPADLFYPVCMETPMTCSTVASSNKIMVGLDVLEHDSSLAALTPEQVFENFFGMDPVTFRAAMVTIETQDGSVYGDAHLAKNEVIWVEGDASIGSLTVGCAKHVTGVGVCSSADVKPSILIVNGDLDASSTPHFYGIVFVMGNLDIGGNVTVHGALVSAGNMSNSTGGSLDVWYNSDILRGVRRAGPLSGLAGSWRDF